MSVLKQRIIEYLDCKRISHNKFYNETQFSHGALSRPGGVTEENLLRFLQYASDVNHSWLATGQGSMLKEQKSEPVPENTSVSSDVLDRLERLAAENALLKAELAKLKSKSE